MGGAEARVTLNICGFEAVTRVNYFGRDPVSRTEVEGRVKRFKNGEVVDKDTFTGEMIKSEGELVIDLVWILCDMAYGRNAMIVPLHKGKRKRTKCKNCRNISALNAVENVDAGVIIGSST